ncbi:MAG: hypothetical protein M1142_04185 [Patescibacteria group bacterium]|nr:hypothetical protein [Patescibacteria group bacterium]
MEKLKIYLGCALTHAAPEFRDSVDQLKDTLRRDFEVLDFIGLVKGTPRDVFEWDLNCVRRCDLFVAECTYPSIGLGYELAVAVHANQAILAVAQQDAKVTRLVLGIDHPKYSFHRYRELSEVADLINNRTANLEQTFIDV